MLFHDGAARCSFHMRTVDLRSITLLERWPLLVYELESHIFFFFFFFFFKLVLHDHRKLREKGCEKAGWEHKSSYSGLFLAPWLLISSLCFNCF